MNRIVFAMAFAIGLATVAWVGMGFVGVSWLALAMTVAIAAVYVLGAWEVQRYRVTTTALAAALAHVAEPTAPGVAAWLERVPAALRHPVRLRIEGERAALPGLALTPYLVGLLVMLGMLGTFLGMVVTFKGAVFALEGSTDLQAIRTALAAPIKGLGLSFGTSVAGVATSAMLGLLSTLGRRERLAVVRQLDSLAATVFRPLSLAHQRQEAFKAMQTQAQALPEVVDRLQAMVDGLERRSAQLNTQLQEQQERLSTQLLSQQDQFHRDVSGVYTQLAQSVGTSLQDSLVAGAKAAGESLRPVVQAAMAEIAQESNRVHQRVLDATQAQISGLTFELGTTARSVGDGWATALQQHARGSEAQVAQLGQALESFSTTFEQRSATLLATVHEAAAASQSQQVAADQQRLQGWTQALEAMATQLQGEWQRVGAQTLADQRSASLSLAQTASDITDRASQQVGQTLMGVAGVLARSEVLVQSRTETEARWAAQQGERMDQLAALWRSELGALRAEEASRGVAAVERLDALQTALASHLATLGTALEAPMTRLMQTAAEVPQAAAGVITQLRQEMTRLSERDNLAFEERSSLLEKISTLLLHLNQASGAQQTAIESLVASAATVLDQAAQQFANTLGTHAGQAADVAAHVAGSAVELASLGEAFSHGVQLFSASNEKLMDSLHRMEGSIGQSVARSDEQLAYYVAQAREVIDLSISSQQGLVEDLRSRGSSRGSKPAAMAKESMA
ncbi:DUF802 domain-containing protein [Rhodoferax sp. WC2427]|uniref:DUF802 domain-containing protein n=1 Tax=Rhodoferax sp. WC2427 TaxID=3234144 RepID=UPI00346534DC